MNYLNRTFVPEEDPENCERRTLLDGQQVVVYKPKGKVSGLSFVLTAANLPLSKYASIISALNSANHVVIGLYISILNPLQIGNNLHRSKAERIPPMFHELREEFNVNKYDIVGHSIGGKIALLTAALFDDENLIRNVLALDPVDQSPVEFTNDSALKQANTNQKGRDNVSLRNSKADIVITCTESGYFVSKAHNGREIQKNNPSVKLVMHRNSCHMVYTDDGGTISWKALMGSGTSPDRNQAIKQETLQLIQERANSSMSAGVTKGVSGIKGKVMKGIYDGVADLKELGNDAEKKANKLKGAAMFGKFMS
jgi:hypothetical protein